MCCGQVHAKWTFVTKSKSMCSLNVRVGKIIIKDQVFLVLSSECYHLEFPVWFSQYLFFGYRNESDVSL